MSLYTAIQLRPVVPNFERLHYVNLLRLKNRRMSVSRELLDVRQSRENQKNNVEQNEERIDSFTSHHLCC